jgi:hypothetical protein
MKLCFAWVNSTASRYNSGLLITKEAVDEADSPILEKES